MALRPSATGQFKRDRKRADKRGKDLSKLTTIMTHLVEEAPLEPRHRDHQLSGNYSGHRECHIEPDWLLIYRIAEEEITLYGRGRIRTSLNNTQRQESPVRGYPSR